MTILLPLSKDHSNQGIDFSYFECIEISRNKSDISKMSFHHDFANAIYQAILPHEKTVKKIESLIMWQNWKMSTIMVLIIELVFVGVYFLPFSWYCNLTIIFGAPIVLYSIFSAYSNIFDKLFSFESDQADSTNLHSVRSVAAYLTTCFSFLITLLELAFDSIENSSFLKIVATLLCFFSALIITFFLGDFWTLWLVFHIIFLLPGLLLSPTFNKWLNDLNKADVRPQSINTIVMENSASDEGVERAVQDENDNQEEEQNEENEEQNEENEEKDKAE